MNLTRISIQRPIVLLMAILALVVLGWRAKNAMPAELDPRVEMPVVNVMTIYPGAGPQEVEERVSRPLEDAVGSVSNVTAVSSRSLENLSFVTVTFKLGSDINAAAADVRAKLESVRRDLPKEIQTPQVAKFDYNARPMMVMGVTGGGSLQELRRIAEKEIRPRLSQIPGVGSVDLVGGRQREIQVRVDPDRLEAAGVTLLDLLRPLGTASQSAPAGNVRQGDRDIAVRVLGEFGSLEDLRNTPIPVQRQNPAAMMGRGMMAQPPPSAPIRLGDIATITDTLAEREQITRVGERDSIGLVLSRTSDANTVQVAEHVKRELATMGQHVPSDVKISMLQDHSQTVADALEDINFTLILGAILAVAVVLVFLHSIKDTVIVALAIPISIIVTFLVMKFSNFSLNQMTMLALSLSVGILVDDSILVLECIHRHRAMGKAPFEAAMDGREEIGLADAANTFVDVVVFVPIAFMGGIVGQFFREFGLTIASATLASLYVSFTLTPMLAARWYRKGEGLPPELGGPVKRGFPAWFDARYERVEAVYRRMLRWALRHRLAVVSSGFGLLVVVGLLGWQVLGFDFAPSVDRGQVSVEMELAPGSSLEATDRLMQQVEAVAAKIPEVDHDRMLASVGEILGGFGSLPDRGAQFGQLTLMLKEKQGTQDRILNPFGTGKRTRSDEAVAAELRERLKSLPESQFIRVNAVRGMTSALAPIQIGLYSSNLEDLERVSAEVLQRLSRVDMLRNAASTMQPGKPELEVAIDRERSDDLYVSSAELAGVLRTAVAGNTDSRYRDGESSFPIRLLVSPNGPNGLKADPEKLRNLVVAWRGPSPVYVGDVATVRQGQGPTKIMRSRRSRKAVVTAYLKEGFALGDARKAVDAALGEMRLGSVERRWEGDVTEMQDSSVLMAGALGLAMILSYMLMAALFNSMIHPFTIMLSVPMALVGGLLGLIYTGTTMNIVSMIGIVMLTGLVSKNAILLVDYTNQLRKEGHTRDAAIQAAGPVRLRPILMTTFAMVVGMLPVAMQFGRASEMRSPMAVVVIGGLLLSTLLTLLVIPCMYTYMDDFLNRAMGAWRKWFPIPAGGSSAEPFADNGHRDAGVAIRKEPATTTHE